MNSPAADCGGRSLGSLPARSDAGWAGRHPLAALLLFYAALSLLFGWDLLCPGRSLFRWDTLLYNWPVALETRTQFLAGRMPFWASSFCCGTPLLENINAGVLYPLRVLCWLLPLRIGYHAFLLAHLWLGFVGMHVLVRRGFRLSRLAAFAGALAYGASGYAHAMWDTHNFMALPWVPLGLAAVLEARRGGRWSWSVLGAAACWSMMILGGDLQAALLWLPAAVLLAAVVRERGRTLGALAVAALVACLLTAPQWLPAWLHAGESYRAGGLDLGEAVERSFHPMRLLELLVPHAFGSHAMWFGSVLAGEGASKPLPWTASFHVGLIALLGAVLALRKRRLPPVRWALVVVLFSTLLSFGRFLPGYAAWLRVPLVGLFRYPEKFLLWATLGLAVLGAHGVPTLLALWHRARLAAVRRRVLLLWLLALAVGIAVATLAVRAVAPHARMLDLWVWGRILSVLIVAGVVLAAALPARRGRLAAWLPLALVVDLLVPWSAERVTTRRLELLAPPAVAQFIGQSDAPEGRFLRDRAARFIPLPANYEDLPGSEKLVVQFRESLAFNTPRLWGLSSAEGFSPAESAAMRSLRLRDATPADEMPADAASFAAFCRAAGVRWILTTAGRARAFAEAGLETEVARSWGEEGELVLLRATNVKEAEFTRPRGTRAETARLPDLIGVWRARPGFIRVSCLPGSRSDLFVRESYGRGWRAEDEWGSALEVVPVDGAFLGVSVPAGTSQVRLSYRPVGWYRGCILGLTGLLLAAVVAGFALGRAGLPKMAGGAAAVCGCALFLVVGVLARGHWACVFDEGFHLARGLARLEAGDSRLSYFHPPLQNMVCAYFADLAFADRLRLPDTPGWHNADVFPYATDLAMLNRSFYPELVRASRWGTALFGLLLCAVGVLWARRAGGPAAAWVAACGLGLNPSLLAHGHLNTTDMGVAALALAGTYAAWRFETGASRWALLWATAAFVLAAVSKLSGVIWLGLWVLVAVPLFALARRDARLLLFSALAVAGLVLAVLALYGLSPQMIRASAPAWLAGRMMPAGRYVEGLLAQGDHALVGQRAYFAGQHFVRARWWHMPVSVALKTPMPWLALLPFAASGFIWTRRRGAGWAPWTPVVLFAVLLCFANRLAIGVRHALPLVALMTIGVAVWAGRIARPRVRAGFCAALVVSSLLTAAATHPDYISYFPVCSGGVAEGHRWLVDSNYDWGQDLETLEESWAAIIHANGGRPPDLIYFGFVDPRVIYDLPVGPRSWCGFMHRTWMQGRGAETYRQWLEQLPYHEGTVVASLSALALKPYGVDFSPVTRGTFVGRVGNSFAVYRIQP